MGKDFITNVVKKVSIVHKSAKKGQNSFRITQQLLQSIWYKSKKLHHVPALIITIPANEKEEYKITCHVDKVKK